MPRPLCVLLPEVGIISETFIRWDARELLPGGTAIVADPPPLGASVHEPRAWDVDDLPALEFTPAEGDPPPSIERRRAVAQFLAHHGVEVVLVEYLDFARRWFDELSQLGLRVWLRGHGVDLSARLREDHWRRAYMAYQAAAGVIVPSRAAAQALHAVGLAPDKVHVVRYCVEVPDRVVRAPTAAGEVRCVAVGRLVPKKAPQLLLEAFRRAAAHDERLTLDLIGGGPLMDQVVHTVAEYRMEDRIRVHGPLPHVQTLRMLREADILLHHAVTAAVDGDAEGQPLVILEAMAAGVPVIATNHAGIPEVVADGINGRLVAEGDVDGMAVALRELSADPGRRHDLGLAGRAVVEREHTYEFARQTLLTLMELPGAEPVAVGTR